MSQKNSKKLRQIYRRDLKGELNHFDSTLDEHFAYCRAQKPKLIPNFIWNWLCEKVLQRQVAIPSPTDKNTDTDSGKDSSQ